MTVEIMRGFGVTRRRGTESGGILLGHVQNGAGAAITIDEFEAVPCEYAFGPSYVLSPNDQPRLADALTRWQDAESELRPLGLWRSHTREGLTLEQADADLFEAQFRKHGRLVLLLKPFGTRPPTAGVVFPKKGKLPVGPAPFEFPFSPSLDHVTSAPESITGTTESVTRAEEPVRQVEPLPVSVLVPLETVGQPAALESAPSETAVSPGPEPQVEPSETAEVPVLPERARSADNRLLTNALGPRGDPGSSPGSMAVGVESYDPDKTAAPDERPPSWTRGRWLSPLTKVVLAASSVALGFVAGYQLAGGHIGVYPSPGMSRPDASAALNLGLTLDRVADRIRLRWSPDAMVAQLADSGKLTVEENGVVIEQQLQPVELRGGTVLYRPGTGAVRFRLELALPRQRTVTETVLWRTTP